MINIRDRLVIKMHLEDPRFLMRFPQHVHLGDLNGGLATENCQPLPSTVVALPCDSFPGIDDQLGEVGFRLDDVMDLYHQMCCG